MFVDIPAWITVAHAVTQGVVACFGALLVGLVSQWIVTRPLAALPADLHWSARARLVFPVRRSLALTAFFLAFAFGIVPANDERSLAVVSRLPLAFASLAGASLGVSLAFARSRLQLGLPKIAWRDRLCSFATSVVVLYPLLVVAAFFYSISPRELSIFGAIWAAAFAVATWVCAAGLPFRLAGKLGLAVPAPVELSCRVDAMALQLGLQPVETRVLRMSQLNAYAIPHLRLVLVTDALLRHMSAPEIAAILAHELGHVGETAVVVRQRKILMWVVYAVVTGAWLLGALNVSALIQVACLLALLSLKNLWGGSFSRKAEELADQVGMRLEEKPGLFAQTLERLYQLHGMPAVMVGAGQAHPHLYDRMQATGVDPDFVRPEPPDAKAGSNALAFACAIAILSAFGAQHIIANAATLAEGFGVPRVALALGGAGEHRLASLAAEAEFAGQHAAAGRLFEAAARVALQPQSSLWSAAAVAYARGDACEEATATHEIMRKRGLLTSTQNAALVAASRCRAARVANGH